MYFLHLCQKSGSRCCIDIYLGLLFYPSDLCVWFVPISCYFITMYRYLTLSLAIPPLQMFLQPLVICVSILVLRLNVLLHLEPQWPCGAAMVHRPTARGVGGLRWEWGLLPSWSHGHSDLVEYLGFMVLGTKLGWNHLLILETTAQPFFILSVQASLVLLVLYWPN